MDTMMDNLRQLIKKLTRELGEERRAVAARRFAKRLNEVSLATYTEDQIKEMLVTAYQCGRRQQMVWEAESSKRSAFDAERKRIETEHKQAQSWWFKFKERVRWAINGPSYEDYFNEAAAATPAPKLL